MSTEVHSISDKTITLEILNRILSNNIKIELSKEAKDKIQKCRQYVDDKLKNATEPIYGINTGFGSLYNKNISYDQLEKLQDNLVKSHACGTGPEVPAEIVKPLKSMFSNFPPIFQISSVGLAPLAYAQRSMLANSALTNGS